MNYRHPVWIDQIYLCKFLIQRCQTQNLLKYLNRKCFETTGMMYESVKCFWYVVCVIFTLEISTEIIFANTNNNKQQENAPWLWDVVRNKFHFYDFRQ